MVGWPVDQWFSGFRGWVIFGSPCIQEAIGIYSSAGGSRNWFRGDGGQYKHECIYIKYIIPKYVSIYTYDDNDTYTYIDYDLKFRYATY